MNRTATQTDGRDQTHYLATFMGGHNAIVVIISHYCHRKGITTLSQPYTYSIHTTTLRLASQLQKQQHTGWLEITRPRRKFDTTRRLYRVPIFNFTEVFRQFFLCCFITSAADHFSRSAGVDLMKNAKTWMFITRVVQS